MEFYDGDKLEVYYKIEELTSTMSLANLRAIYLEAAERADVLVA